MRARLRFFFSPWRAKTRAMACARGNSSPAGTNESKSFAWYGTAPKPPPTYMAKPRVVFPFSVRSAAINPKSCIIAKPQACCEQPLNDGLNFRPKFWQSGWPSRNFESASE